MTAARPWTPSASQPAWARRARATSSATSPGATIGTVAITCPLAGFSTTIVSAPWAAPVAVVLGTVVVSVTSLLRLPLPESYPVAGCGPAPERASLPSWLASQGGLGRARLSAVAIAEVNGQRLYYEVHPRPPASAG